MASKPSIAQMIAGSAARYAEKKAAKAKQPYTEEDHRKQMLARKMKAGLEGAFKK